MNAKPYFIGALLGGALSVAAQHAHVNAGALSVEQGALLYFANGGTFATNSGYVVSLEATNAGRFAGWHEGSISFTALPATPLTGGPAIGHAALGSFLELEIQSATGPENGVFGFWETGDLAPRFSEPVGAVNGTNRFALSEGDGAPGSDPYGHIHGRHFTASEPGLYAIGFRIVDTSRNGAGGGPIHAPSEPWYLFFQAGVGIESARWEAGSLAARFGTRTGSNYHLERTEELGSSNEWTSVAGPIGGNNRLQTLTDESATNRAAYYRLRRSPP